MIACLFGDPNAPVAQWLNANGNRLLIVEFVAVIVLSLLAMVVDRVRTLRGIDEEPFDDVPPAPATAASGANTQQDSPAASGE